MSNMHSRKELRSYQISRLDITPQLQELGLCLREIIKLKFEAKIKVNAMIFNWKFFASYDTRKYPLRGYSLGSGASGTPGVTHKTYGTTFISDILGFACRNWS